MIHKGQASREEAKSKDNASHVTGTKRKVKKESDKRLKVEVKRDIGKKLKVENQMVIMLVNNTINNLTFII
ncbi:hypothetical protein QVD17_39241 [Tagetes erecta]|uniref:Uncharacterized protein n=1 Tax=Tagetes erecta TaxID=13708 RepID=A0AAD8JRZ8_TARER|nr:hypothetical protein QVD17_39241 [Tagetes erecta]